MTIMYMLKRVALLLYRLVEATFLVILSILVVLCVLHFVLFFECDKNDWKPTVYSSMGRLQIIDSCPHPIIVSVGGITNER